MKACIQDEKHNTIVCQASMDRGAKNTLAKLKGKQWQQLIAKIAHNWRTRNRLSHLNEAQLKDIGLSAADVDHEVRKPLWK